MHAHAAGWMLSFSAFPGIAAALVFPTFAKRMRHTWIPITLSVASQDRHVLAGRATSH